MTLRCERLVAFWCVFQGLRPSVFQVWHHGGGLPGQLHVSGADHLQLQSAGMNVLGEKWRTHPPDEHIPGPGPEL